MGASSSRLLLNLMVDEIGQKEIILLRKLLESLLTPPSSEGTIKG